MEYKTQTGQSIFQGGIALKNIILLLTDVTVYNCAWNYIISLNEKIFIYVAKPFKLCVYILLCIILGVLLMVRGKVYRRLCSANACCTLIV